VAKYKARCSEKQPGFQIERANSPQSAHSNRDTPPFAEIRSTVRCTAFGFTAEGNSEESIRDPHLLILHLVRGNMTKRDDHQAKENSDAQHADAAM
jgi:hypothetical protein